MRWCNSGMQWLGGFAFFPLSPKTPVRSAVNRVALGRPDAFPRRLVHDGEQGNSVENRALCSFVLQQPAIAERSGPSPLLEAGYLRDAWTDSSDAVGFLSRGQLGSG